MGHLPSFGRCLHWLGCFVLYVGATLLLGGLVGMALYAVVGWVTHPELALDYRLAKGFLNGVFYAGVWATGIGLVLCVMRAHRERRARQGEASG